MSEPVTSSIGPPLTLETLLRVIESLGDESAPRIITGWPMLCGPLDCLHFTKLNLFVIGTEAVQRLVDAGRLALDRNDVASALRWDAVRVEQFDPIRHQEVIRDIVNAMSRRSIQEIESASIVPLSPATPSSPRTG